MALIMLPMPLIGLWRSMSDVLQVAPDELDSRVHAVMESIVKERSFSNTRATSQRSGRGKIRRDPRAGGTGSRIDIATADAIRRDIAKRLNAVFPNFWLTVDFTADRAWL